MGYSRTVPVDELSGERLDATTEYHAVGDRDDAVAELSKDPIVEVGREDGRRVGGDAVIRPCPLCGGEHTHKFGDDLEAGKPDRRAADCPETELYWLVWFGEGDGDWRDDERFRDEPRL